MNPDSSSSIPAVHMSGVRPQQRGTPYTSAGGGEAVLDGTLSGLYHDIIGFFLEERSRPEYSAAMMIGPDMHNRPPRWLEDKLLAIDGTPLTEADLHSSKYWQHKYRHELDVAEAIQELKKTKRFEETHDIIGSVAWFKRKLGWSVPLDEEYVTQQVRLRHTLEEETRRLSGTSTSRAGAQLIRNAEDEDVSQSGVLSTRPRVEQNIGTPWKVLVESIQTGRPLVKVAQEYRPRTDYYGLDAFLDSSASLVWFSTKCGVAIGLVQGTLKAAQAINVDLAFLRASGVGLLSVLNVAVLSSVIKWGGNMSLLASAFCVGDRLATRMKSYVLPLHDAQSRSTVNYVIGLSFSGGAVGVLPWWVLNDVALAARLAVSGAAVGAALGLTVGTVLGRLVSANVSRLDASSRHLRRYEALMLRERAWAEAEKAKQSPMYVWW